MQYLIDKLNLNGKQLRTICSFPRYMITEYGEVIDMLKEREISQIRGNNGYLFVNLCKGKKRYFKTVHRLVAKAYLPNPNGLPEVNHLSGNKHNNHYINLAWCNSKENSRHASFNNLIDRKVVPHLLFNPDTYDIRRFTSKQAAQIALKDDYYNGWKMFPVTLLPRLGTSKPVVAFNSEDGKFVGTFANSKKAGNTLGVNRRSIEAVCKGAFNTAKGYHFKYLHEMPVVFQEYLLINNMIGRQTLELYTDIFGNIDMFAIGSITEDLEKHHSDKAIETMLTHPFCTQK